MTVQTEFLHLLYRLRFPFARKAMAGHALLVVGGQRREGGLILVAEAALLMPRPGGIRLCGCILLYGTLVVRVVAGQACVVFPGVIDLRAAVNALPQLLEHVVVAGQAVVRME
jgi:hypothetical protein